MTKKFLSLILAFLMLAAILANVIACNSTEQGGGVSNTSADTEPEATESGKTTEVEDATDPSDENDTQNVTENDSTYESDKVTNDESDTSEGSDTEDESEDENGEPDISVEKTVSHSAGMTVYPGELITYSFVIKNSGSGRGTIEITDTIPTNTSYVSGAGNAEGSFLSWKVTVTAGETKTVSYTVKVGDDLALCDGGVVAPGACKAGEFELTTHSLYIERTLNAVDQQYFDIAVEALKSAEYFTGFNLYRWMYGVAFTYAQAVSGAISIANDTPSSVMDAIANGSASATVLDMVAPGLYGGSAINGAISGIKGSPSKKISGDDLISGDGILITKNGKTDLFVYSNVGTYCLTGKCTEADLGAVLSSLESAEKYAVLRPSSNLLDFTPSDVNEKPEEMTDKQAAVVATAYYYLLRGECLQYDDSFMNKLSDSFSDFNESRWQTEFRTPESYTPDEWGYLNCAAFTNDVYWSTFGVSLPGDMYYTGNIYTNSAKYNMRVYSFERNLNKTYTDAEKAAMEAEFMSNLQPADLIVIRRKNGGGHVMVYIGNGRFIHATGDSMNTTALEGVKENREPTLRFHRVKDYFFNRDGALNSSNVFNDPTIARATTSIAIVRPLANSTYASYSVTDTTKARMDIIGLIIKKTASVNHGVSVNPGSNITYTFTLDNTRSDDITVEITDKIPANTTYVSGCDNRNGDNLSWTVTIPAGKTITVSYTVQVSLDAIGTVIQSDDAKVAGIPLPCVDIEVERTLTAEEQSDVVGAFTELKTSGTSLRGLALVNEIYKNALGVGNVFADVHFLTVTEGENGIYEKSNLPIQSNYTYENFTRNEESTYYKMLVSNLFGGRSIRSNGRNEWVRTRGAMVDNLVIGDVILGKRRDGNTYIFMYTGEDKMINLNTLTYDSVDAQTTLDRLLGYDYFAVLRPSFALSNTDTEKPTPEATTKLTLNVTDQKYFDMAVMAMRRSEYFKGFELLKWTYCVAFSNTTCITSVIDTAKDTHESVLNGIINGTASEALLGTVAPSLYGGTKVSGAISGIQGDPSATLTANDLISGDAIIISKNGMYDLFMYSGCGLYCITDKCTEADLDEVLSSIATSDAYAVLRPSVNLTNFTPADVNEHPVELTEKQKAIVATAYTYLLRGEWNQYQTDSANMNLTPEYNEVRAQLAHRAPEDCSSANWGYTNCSSFTYDVYWQTFGVKLPGNLYTTKGLFENAGSMKVYSFMTDMNKTYTDAEKSAIQEEFLSVLQPGDILVVRRKNGTGHAMLYVGNGQIIHSNGLSVTYDDQNWTATEIREPTVRFQKVVDYFFGAGGALFRDPSDTSVALGVVVVRPLADATYSQNKITETTKARLEIIGLVIEKRATAKPGVSVNPGEDIIYTFVLDNTSANDITVDIFDKIPAYTTFVSGCNDRNGDKLSWTVTVPAGKTVEVSYTVKVNGDALGKVIESKDATVASIPLTYSDIYVKTTLTETEQQGIVNVFNQLKDGKTNLRGLALVNEIYENVIGVKNIFADLSLLAVTEGEQGIFTSSGIAQANSNDVFARNESGEYYNMLVPTLFGGRYLRSEKTNEWIRTRAAWEYNLVIGDIILAKTSSGTEMYMYLGDGVLVDLYTLKNDSVNIQIRLDMLLGYKYYFAIIRPSFVADAGDNDTAIDPDTCTHTAETIFGENGAYTIICTSCGSLIRDFNVPESVNWHSSLDAMNKYATISISKKLYDEENALYYNSFTGNTAGHINVTGGTGSGSATSDEFEIGKYIVIKYRGSNTQLALYAGATNGTKKMLGSYQARDAMPGDEWRVAVVSLENVSSFANDTDGKSTVYVMLETYSSISYNVDIAYVAIVDSLDEAKLLLEDGEDYYYYGTKFSSTPVKNGGVE